MTKVKVKVNVADLNKNATNIKNIVKYKGFEAMKDNMKELNKTAGDTAPVDEGILETSGADKVTSSGKTITGTVHYEAWSNSKGRRYEFNYAIWIHEQRYKLGPKSQAKPNARGKSGKTYKVGRKYLTRVLEGEKNYYRKHIEKTIKEGLRGN